MPVYVVDSDTWFALNGIWRKVPPEVTYEHNDNGHGRRGNSDTDAEMGRQDQARDNAI